MGIKVIHILVTSRKITTFVNAHGDMKITFSLLNMERRFEKRNLRYYIIQNIFSIVDNAFWIRISQSNANSSIISNNYIYVPDKTSG
jgi:hypothetical protein